MRLGRHLSLGSVGLLALLTAAAGLWSALTGPRIADVQLHQATANLIAASSFTAVVDETESVIGTSEQVHIHEVLDYVAPDRQMVTREITEGRLTGGGTLTQIGGSCWIHNTGPFTRSVCNRAAFQAFLDHLRQLEHSTDVSDNGGTYFLTPPDSSRWILADVPGNRMIGMAEVEARIDGETLSSVRVSFDASLSGASVLVYETLQFAAIDHGPAIVTPAGPPTSTAS